MIPFPLSSIKKVCEKTGAMPSFLGENTFFPGNPKKRMKQIEHDVWLYLYKYYMFYLFRGCYNLPIFLNTGSVSHFRDAALRWDKALEHSHSAPSNSPGEMLVLWGFDGVSMGKPHTYIIYIYIYIWIIINPFCGNKIGYIMIYIYIYIWYTLKYSNRLYIAWCLGVSKNWDILPSSTPTLPSWEGKSSNAKKGALSILRHIQHYGWLVVWNINFMIFHNSWEFHHPNWRTPSFFRGVGWNHQPDGEMAIFPGISRWWFDCFPTSWWIGIP